MMDLFECLGWENLDVKVTVIWNESKPDMGCAPFGKPVPQISLPLPSQTMKKKERKENNEQCDAEHKSF